MRRSARPLQQRLAQRGQTLLILLMILGIGFGAWFYTFAGPAGSTVERDKINAVALAQVKEALIGWSATRTPTASNPNARPGELPCPDTDNNGYAENDDNNDGIDEASCAAGTIGRVPWKTLGIPEPKDSAGETLWYAISGNFRIYRSITPNIYTSPITSNTLGTITVYQESTSTTITDNAIAVIFAPGVALGTQDRSTTTTMSCAAPSGTYFRNQCASNYLETSNGINNAAINGPYISAQSSSTFNDRLLVITNADLMPLVEQRVAKEMIGYLNSYRSTTAIYPWADLADGNSNGALGTFAYNKNRFPCDTALPYNWGRAAAPVTPSLPNWLTNGCDTSLTGWFATIFYTVAKNRLESGGAGCAPSPNCTAGTLTLTNSSSGVATQCNTASPPVCASQVVTTGSADVLLITPGAWDGVTARTWPSGGWTTISGYFEDSENSDNNDENYVVPTSTATNRDRVYFVR